MLILTRKPGQSILIGDVMVTIRRIDRHETKVSVGDEIVWFKHDETRESGIKDVEILITKNGYHVDSNSVKVGIQAPKYIKIVRTELLDKGVR